MAAVMTRARYRRDPEEKRIILEKAETRDVPDDLLLGACMQAASDILPEHDREALREYTEKKVMAGVIRLI